MNKLTFFYCLVFSLLPGKLILCCWFMAFAIWSIGSLPTPFEHIWFHMLFHPTRWLRQWQLRQKQELYHDQHFPKRFWLPASISKQIFPSMCKHGVVNKVHDGSPLMVLCAFYRWEVSVLCKQAISILRHVIVTSEGSFRLSFSLVFQYASCD